MVLKPKSAPMPGFREFESDVISDGTQTYSSNSGFLPLFESDVISDGTQTAGSCLRHKQLFESDVISDGTQTDVVTDIAFLGLRVM